MQKYWARLQKLFIRAAVRWALQKHPKVAFLAAIVTAIALAGLWHISQAGHYRLSLAEQKLLAAPSVEKSKVVFKNGGLAYQTGAAKASRQLTVAGATDATGKDGYSAQLPADPKKGLQFSAAGSDLPVKLIPLDQMGGGKYIDGHYVYPSPGGKSIYTLRKNGVKEDIVLSKAPGDTLKYSWKLELGSQLEAKLMPNGTVGIYSANPLLSDSNLKISDAKSQQLIDNARKNGKKDNLVYVIPAPLLKDAGGKESNSGVKFNLSDNILTLTATNLKTKNYPLSIDPTIVVTTSADFATGYDDGNINYATANEINRGNISLGTVSGTWSSTSTFTQARISHTSVAYNGYLYVMGGLSSSSANDCTATSNYCNGVQYAPINANGTIGAWHYTHNSTDDNTTFIAGFTQARHSHTSVAYNGYLYVIGGVSSSSANDCTAINNECNGVQYAPINANGTIGSWSSTTAFTQARHSHTSVAYNGYLYVIGGVSSSSANDCTATSNYCNGVQYAPINANGTIGSWSSTTAFTQARHSHTSVAYNGYLYVIGGVSSSSANDCTATSNYCNGVQYNSINTGTPSFGTLGTWSSINTITTARDHHTSVAYNGYLYIIGGTNGSFQNNVLYATINSDGTVGTWNTATNAFNVARKSHTSVVYNGYLYVIGGRQLNPATSCKPVGDTSSQICRDIQYALICTGSNSGSGGCDSTAGNIGTWNTNSNTFTTTRYGHTSVAYNGYLYVMGGCTDTNCTTILSDIQYAPISSDGSVGVWNTTNSIITARYGPTSVAYNGYLYVIGGCSAGVGCSAFQNDVQYALICTGSNNGSAGCGATAGTVGTWNTTNTFTTARFGHTSVAYNGYLYVINGEDLSGRINDVQIARYSGPEQAATYEKTLDFGSLAKINSIIFNGIAPPLCGAGLVYPLINYKLAGTNGVYGSTSQITAAAGSTYNINKMGFRYMQIQFKLDDSYCGGTSKITDFTVDYQTAPDTPELILPSSGATAISGMPVFQLRSAGPNLNYLRYNVKVYTVQASCDSDSATDLIRDADQTSSQTGWNGQDQQTNTAYANSTTVTSSTIASYLYQLPGLVPGSTYWWKGRAIDPGNTNTWGNWATCQSFTTTQPELRLQGGTDIRGGTKIGP
jgi:hypothetical protein